MKYLLIGLIIVFTSCGITSTDAPEDCEVIKIEQEEEIETKVICEDG